MRTLLLGLLLAFSPLPLFASDSLPTLLEIQNHLRRWHEDFVNFRVVYENTWPGTPIIKRREYLMTDTKEYLEVEDWFGRTDRPKPFREVRGGNQQSRFRAQYELNEQSREWELTGVTKEPRKSSNVGSSLILQPLGPLFHVHSGTWLDDTILDHEVTVKPGGVIDGEECVLLEIVYKNEQSFAGDQIWLAVNKGYLPKKTKPLKSEVLKNLPYYCDSFTFDGVRWQPLRGRIGDDPDVNHWNVTRFEVNSKISPSDFRAPDDSHLEASRKERRRTSQRETSPLQPDALRGQKPPTARPREWSVSFWAMMLFLFSACIGVAAFWKSRRAA